MQNTANLPLQQDTANNAVDVLLTNAYLEQLQSALRANGVMHNSLRFVILHDEGLDAESDHLLCHSSDFVVMMVMELSHHSLPFLKYADFLIFSTEEQARLYRDTYVATVAHDVWQCVPALQTVTLEKDCTHLTIICPAKQSLGRYQKEAQRLKTLLSPYRSAELQGITLLSRCEPEVLEVQLHDIADILQISPNEVLTEQEHFQSGIKSAAHTLVYQPENTSPYDNPEHCKLIGTNHFRVLEFCLESPLYREAPNRAKSSAVVTPQKLLENLAASIASTPSSQLLPEVDTLQTLNIVLGAPLSNSFIVSILYRNAGTKLLRSLQSVIDQKEQFDVGVVLIDDGSTDHSLAPAIALLERSGIPSVVVQNLDRKYAARNYYNMIHRLTTNDHSVIIDLDGDDYLNPEHNTFATLERHYQLAHIQKVMGSYTLLSDQPEQQKRNNDFLQHMEYFADLTEVRFDNPWNLTLCPSWKHLRTTRRDLLRKVEIDYFMERSKTQWLRMEHDISVHSRAIELAPGQTRAIPEKLYVYDIGGDNHDNHDQARSKNSHIYKLFHAYTFSLPGESPPAASAPEAECDDMEIDLI